MKAYLNNAGAGLMSDATYSTVRDHLNLEMKVGAYEAAKVSQPRIDDFYIRAAKLINAAYPDEIAFMDSASRGWNAVINGACIEPSTQIITFSSEFGTNLLTLFNRAQHVGAKVIVIECDVDGSFSMDDVESVLRKGKSIIAISHAAAHCSIINPVEDIGKLARKYDAKYIVDGCQAIGQIDVNVRSINCDAYIATGRKWLCGPRGTGFLYVKRYSCFQTTQLDVASADLIFGDNLSVKGVKIRTDARQFELWERSIACMLGLSTSINEYIGHDKVNFSNRIRILSNSLRNAIKNNQHINLLGKIDSASGIVGFYLNSSENEEKAVKEFANVGIGISTMGEWDCPLHFPKNGVTKILRLSPHYYTEENVVDAAREVIKKL